MNTFTTKQLATQPTLQKIVLKNDYRDQLSDLCLDIAEHICRNQTPAEMYNSASGTFPWLIFPDGSQELANNWNHAFAIIGLLDAAKFYGNQKFESAAFLMARWIKSLQILDKFNTQHYGAIREITPLTNWSYPRDAISVGWAFLELYEYTGDNEHLERAILFAEWFTSNALDDEGWPLWGIVFDPTINDQLPQIRNDMQGCFHGGALHFFYLLHRITGNPKWTGSFFIRMADILLEDIQQPSGYFKSIERATKQVPPEDPQSGLHKANDDFCSLGLLDAYKVTGDAKYLHGTEKFITAAIANQQPEGLFDDTIASIPVVLNILHETRPHLDIRLTETQATNAINYLFKSQCTDTTHPARSGGLVLDKNDATVCARGTCYALIVILKILADLDISET